MNHRVVLEFYVESFGDRFSATFTVLTAERQGMVMFLSVS